MVVPTKPDWFPKEPYSWYQVVPRLIEIVESMPEGYVYDREQFGSKACLYWSTSRDMPGCIIGRLMAKLGAPPQFLKDCDNNRRGSGVESLMALGILTGLFDAETGAVLNRIQLHQDGGVSWYESVERGSAYWSGIRMGFKLAAQEALAAQL